MPWILAPLRFGFPYFAPPASLHMLAFVLRRIALAH
jgi:hypothetical protein